MNKQEEREYWTKLLAENDGAVWCGIDGAESHHWIIAYVGGDRPFVGVCQKIEESKIDSILRYKYGDYSTFFATYATPILPKPRRPWTAEEIMAHGVFDIQGCIVRVASATNKAITLGKNGGYETDAFISVARAVCLELRDGILCDTGKRVELYKDGE